MCGLVGFVDPKRRWARSELHALARRMAGTLVLRGPDDQGTWADEDNGLALGFRRLSIIDLTEAGHQPMLSADQKAVIVFNGEIYNANRLRPDLEARGVVLRGRSDTEVMIEACRLWGVEAAVSRFNGMFAFAYWDREDQRLFLVRDRMGIKPLYYGMSGQCFFFGSQPKAFFPHPDWQARLNGTALAEYLRLNYVPHHLSIYEGLAQVPPGGVVSIRPGGAQIGPVRRSYYWNFRAIAREGIANRFAGTHQDAVDELNGLLREAVRDQLVADVPLGAFLSGGIDSSIVVAMMKEVASNDVRTFSIGFGERQYDEAPFARRIAAHLGTDHAEMYVRSEEALGLIPEVASWYDEPLADNSMIATYLVSRLARERVTIALSGDGGDELFGGYPWYRRGWALGATLGRVPRSVRASLASAIRFLSVKSWDRVGNVVPRRLRPERVGDRAHKVAMLLDFSRSDHVYRYLVSQWNDPAELCLLAEPEGADQWMASGRDDVPEFLERMLYYDTIGYLPDDILTKVDRASMAVSLEARVPILDHRIVEFAWRLPMSVRMMGGKPKGLLRQVLARYVPSDLFERPKQGFELPIADWLRGGLREWAEDLISESALKQDGIFAPALVRQRWREHLNGNRNWQYSLWNVLMFQEWKRAWLDQPRDGAAVERIAIKAAT